MSVALFSLKDTIFESFISWTPAQNSWGRDLAHCTDPYLQCTSGFQVPDDCPRSSQVEDRSEPPELCSRWSVKVRRSSGAMLCGGGVVVMNGRGGMEAGKAGDGVNG